jgi:hypothetical protein
MLCERGYDLGKAELAGQRHKRSAGLEDPSGQLTEVGPETESGILVRGVREQKVNGLVVNVVQHPEKIATADLPALTLDHLPTAAIAPPVKLCVTGQDLRTPDRHRSSRSIGAERRQGSERPTLVPS